MLSLSLPVLPSPLSGVKADLPFSDEAAAVSAFSDFVRESAVRYPEWLLQLQDNPPGADEWQHYPLWLQQQLVGVEDEITLMRELRLFRRHMLVRIAWMQTLAQVSTPVSLQQLSVLAETLIVAARDWLWQACCAEWGTPVNATGEPQPLLILGMGKLGGGELNFSSDIDLIFTWPEHGATRGGRRELDNAQFFTRMGQRLIKVLDQPTVDGIVYRVDMRLRPFGDSGPLVLSFAAMEDYYQEQGRDWERYAMVKARVMGDNGDRWCQELQHMLRPFVFRRYIDFSAVQSLRDMKSMIAREVRRRGLVNNIKLGAGGIRETEFIVQVFQLIRGGRERALQQHALLPTLQAIGELNLLPAEQTTTLAAAYLYLRRVENLLQSINDEQTQTLPDDKKNRQRLAWAMAASDWNDFSLQLDAHMAAVRAIFDDLIGEENQNSETDEQSEDWLMLWHQGAAEEDIALLAPQLDQARQQHVVQTLHHFRRDVDKRTIGPRGRQSLDQLMPRLLREVLSRDDAATTLERMVPLLLGIITRSTYLELLMEYPGALKQLIVLCAASPMVASQLARHPLLLDELLDPATLYHPTAPEAYRDELRQYLLRIPSEDEEQQLEALRQFKQAQHLRIAASDIARTLPMMKVSDHLTWLAEAILEQVVQQAWQLMVQRYGRPAHLEDEQGRGFAVIGYGKLGGWELGYSSDLDLVFLHDCPDDVMTVGERSIDGRQFYLRLAQRVMHLFSTRTASGILYDVDARLRPSGAAGMLVSTFAAFDDYQRHEAWTWEHQALVRARLVFGEPALRTRFTALRAGIIALPRNAENLQREVREMREKMYQHLGSKQKGCWDIKTDPGGITDIEFIAQYLVLRNADHSPALTRWSDNVRIFTMLAEGEWLSSTQADELTAAYITLRDALHHLALQALPAEVPLDAFRAEREVVKRCWQHFFV